MANKGTFSIMDAGSITMVSKSTQVPYLHVNYANSMELTTKTDVVYSKVRGLDRIMFSKGSTGEFKLEAEMANTRLFSLLTGSTLSTGAGTILKREVFTVAASMDFTLAESTGITLLGAGTVMADGITEKTSFGVKVGTVAEQGKAVLSSNTVKMYTGDVVANDILVIYYTYSESSVDSFLVSAKPKSDAYEIFADVSIRYDVDLTDDFVQLHIFKAKAKEEISLSFSADNPSKFSLSMTVLPDAGYKDSTGADGLFKWSQIN